MKIKNIICSWSSLQVIFLIIVKFLLISIAIQLIQCYLYTQMKHNSMKKNTTIPLYPSCIPEWKCLRWNSNTVDITELFPCCLYNFHKILVLGILTTFLAMKVPEIIKIKLFIKMLLFFYQLLAYICTIFVSWFVQDILYFLG